MVGADAMVDFDVGVALGGEPLSPAELETLLDGDGELVLLKGQWVTTWYWHAHFVWFRLR